MDPTPIRSVVVVRGSLGRQIRDGVPAEEIEATRAELKAAKAQSYIRRLVDEAPPLTDAQRAKLAALLAPAPREAA